MAGEAQRRRDKLRAGERLAARQDWPALAQAWGLPSADEATGRGALLRAALAAELWGSALKQLHILATRDAERLWSTYRGELERLVEGMGRLSANELLMLHDVLKLAGQAALSERVLQSAAERFAGSLPVQSRWVDAALQANRPATALERLKAADESVRDEPELRLRAARAYGALGQWLGQAETRTISGGRVGQFADKWLLIEKREGADRFWCVPEPSALFQVRRALEADDRDPAARLLHVETWLRAGRPQTAAALLESYEPELLRLADDEALQVFGELLLEAGNADGFLRLARVRAERDAAGRTRVLIDAFRRAADHYSLRGDAAMQAAMLNRALELSPQDVALLVATADAEWTAGQAQAAGLHYQRAVSLDRSLAREARVVERLPR